MFKKPQRQITQYEFKDNESAHAGYNLAKQRKRDKTLYADTRHDFSRSDDHAKNGGYR